MTGPGVGQRLGDLPRNARSRFKQIAVTAAAPVNLADAPSIRCAGQPDGLLKASRSLAGADASVPQEWEPGTRHGPRVAGLVAPSQDIPALAPWGAALIDSVSLNTV